MKIKRNLISNNILLLVILLLLPICMKVSSADMESPRFRIESGTIDFNISENTDMPSKNTALDEDTELFQNKGVIIKTDGQSTHSSPFRFVLEKSLLRMNPSAPNTPAEATTSLMVAGGRSVYQITLSKVEPMKKLSGETIPDTSCNSEKKCTPYIASTWDSVSAFGLGYNITGNDTPDDFKNDRFFRSIPTDVKQENPSIIMKNITKTTERRAQLRLKTIVSAVQADGTYETILNFTAIPGY